MSCPMSGMAEGPTRRCKYCKSEIVGDKSDYARTGRVNWPDECPACHRSFKGRSHHEKRDKKALQQRKADHSLESREDK